MIATVHSIFLKATAVGMELFTDILIAVPSFLGCVLFVVFYRTLGKEKSEAHPIYRQPIPITSEEDPSSRQEDSAAAGAA